MQGLLSNLPPFMFYLLPITGLIGLLVGIALLYFAFSDTEDEHFKLSFINGLAFLSFGILISILDIVNIFSINI